MKNATRFSACRHVGMLFGILATGWVLSARADVVPPMPDQWYDASRGLSLDGDQTVVAWSNVGSRANEHAWNSIAERRPVFAGIGCDGNAAVHFSPEQWLKTDGNVPPPYTILYVARMNGTTKARVLSAGNNWVLGFWNGYGNIFYADGWVADSYSLPADDNWQLYAGSGSGSESVLYRDGETIARNANGLSGPNGLQFNGWNGQDWGNNEGSDCDIAEVMVYRRVLSDEERKLAEDYLRARYGVGAAADPNDAWDPADDAGEGATVLAITAEVQRQDCHTLNQADAEDWFRVDGQAGKYYELSACGGSLDANVALAVFADPAGQNVLVAEGACATTFLAPSNGPCYVRVRRLVYRDKQSYALRYREVTPNPDILAGTVLTATATPQTSGPHALSAENNAHWYRIDLLAGIEYTFDTCGTGTGYPWAKIYSDLAGENEVGGGNGWCESTGFAFRFTPAQSGTYYLCIRSEEAATYSLTYYGVGSWPVVPDAWDPADDVAQNGTVLAFAADHQTSGPHTMSATDNVDWYRVALLAGNTYTFDACGSGSGYPWAKLYADAEGLSEVNSVYGWCDGAGFKPCYAPDHDGTYYFKVMAEDNATYTLTYYGQGVLPVAPDAWDSADDAISGATLLWFSGDKTHGPHTLGPDDREDWFKMNLIAGVECRWAANEASEAMLFDLFSDASGTQVAGGDQYGISYTPESDGTYYLRLRSGGAAGTAVLYSLSYSGWGATELDEYDPADDVPAGATVIEPTSDWQEHLSHSMKTNDPGDWYRLELVAGLTYSFATSTGWWDTYGDIFAAPGTGEPLVADDNSNGDGDFFMTFSPPASGTYYLRVTSHEVGWDIDYSLGYQGGGVSDEWDPLDDAGADGTVLGPTTEAQTHGPHSLDGLDLADWFSVPLERGHRYAFDACGSSSATIGEIFRDAAGTDLVAADVSGACGSGQFSLTFAPSETATYYLRVRSATGSALGYELHYQDLGSFTVVEDAWDPADDIGGGATLLEPAVEAQQQDHTLSTSDGVDWFRFAGRAGMSYEFSACGGSDDANLSLMVFSDAAAQDALTATGACSAVFTAAADGTYYVRVLRKDYRDAQSYSIQYREQTVDPWDPADDVPLGTGATYLVPSLVTAQSHGPHRLSPTDPVDWITFYLSAGVQCYFRTCGGDRPTTAVLLKNVPAYGSPLTEPGEMVQVAAATNNCANGFVLSYTATNRGIFMLGVSGDTNAPEARSYVLQYGIVGDAWDPGDDTSAGANSLTMSDAWQQAPSHFLVDADADWYVVSLTGGKTNEFKTSESVVAGFQMRLFADAAAQQLVASETRATNGCAGLAYAAPESGTYYLRISKNQGDTAAYQLNYIAHALWSDPWDPGDDLWNQNPPTWVLDQPDQAHGPHWLLKADRYDYLNAYFAHGPTYDLRVCNGNGENDDNLQGVLTTPASGSVFFGVDCAGDRVQANYVPATSEWCYLGISRKTATTNLIDENALTNVFVHCRISNIPAGGFTLAGLPGAATSGVPVWVTLVAQDAHDGPVTFRGIHYTNSVALTASGDLGPVAVSPAEVGPFTNGTWSGPVTFSGEDSSVRLNVSNRATVAVSAPFDLRLAIQEGVVPGPFEPLTPANGATNWAKPRQVDWSSAANAAGYRLYFGTNDSPALYAETSSSYLNFSEPLVRGATYRWYVEAFNPTGVTRAPATGYWTLQPTWDCVIEQDLTIDATNRAYDSLNLLIRGAQVTLVGEHSFGDVFLTNGATLTHAANLAAGATNRLELVARTVSISSDSAIDLTGKGWGAEGADGDDSSGGSHGGRGADFQGAARACCGDYRAPVLPGQGTRAGDTGAGGGALHLVADALVLDGEIAANGEDGTMGGAGAGGSVWLDVGALSGAGRIVANGGNVNLLGGAGGGGRVAVAYDDAANFNLANVQARGGQDRSYAQLAGGGAGTVFLKSKSQATGILLVDNGEAGMAGSATDLGSGIADALVASNACVAFVGATVALPPAVQATACRLVTTGAVNGANLDLVGGVWRQTGPATLGDLHLGGTVWSQSAPVAVSTRWQIDGGARWYQDAAAQLPIAGNLVISNYSLYAGTSQTWTSVSIKNQGVLGALSGRRLWVKATQLHVAEDGAIDVTGAGLDGEAKTYEMQAGGSHGGRGGYGTVNSRFTVGDLRQPTNLGPGPRYKTASVGGGSVYVEAGTLTLDGAIRADGSTDYDGYNAAAGGSVWLNVQTLSGAGSVSARGGESVMQGAGGGGGRIAVYYADATAFDFARLVACGGRGAAGRAGGAGTIYLKNGAEALGRITVDNSEVGEAGGSTLLPTNLPEPVTVVDARVVNVEETVVPSDLDESEPEDAFVADGPYERMMSIGNIVVTGLIQQTSGEPLDQVTMRVTQSTLFDSNVVAYVTNASRTFAISCTNCTKLDVSFAKDGYYPEKLSVSFTSDLVEDPATGEVVQKTNAVMESHVVALDPKGQPVEMMSASGLLRFMNGGRFDAFDFAGGGALEERSTSAPGEPWPAHGLYLDVAQSGGIIARTDRQANSVVLTMIAAGDGFIVASTGTCDRLTALRAMKTAPETGYQRTLALTSLTDDTYVYVKVGSRYGKGVVSGLSALDENSRQVYVAYELYWQPTDPFEIEWSSKLQVLDLNRIQAGTSPYETPFDAQFPKNGLAWPNAGDLHLITAQADSGFAVDQILVSNSFDAASQALAAMNAPPSGGYVASLDIDYAPSTFVLFYLKLGNRTWRGHFNLTADCIPHMVLDPFPSRDVTMEDSTEDDGSSVLIEPAQWVAGAPVVATERAPISQTITAPSLAGANVHITAVNLPPGATFVDNGDGTGTLTWVPAWNDVGVRPLAFVCSDGANTVWLNTRIYVGQQNEQLCDGIPCSLRTKGLIKSLSVLPNDSLNGHEVQVDWTADSNVYYDVYASDSALGASMNWIKLASQTGGSGEQSVSDALLESSGARRSTAANSTRFYSVVLRGEPPDTNALWAVHRMDLAGSDQLFKMIAPPLAMDRAFNGEFGQQLAEVMTGSDGGVGDHVGPEVYVLEASGQWRILYLDQNQTWRESNGQVSDYVLAPGQGLFLARNDASATLPAAFPGRVGNVGTNSMTLQPGWNLIGLSEGRRLPIRSTFAAAGPRGGAEEEQTDRIVLQNANGSWRFLMYVQNWGAPYDGNWFDLSTCQIATNVLEPGQAYYYYRQPAAGATSVGF